MKQKLWFIVWPDGTVADKYRLPLERPTGSIPPIGGPFTPYYELREHQHSDGSYHLQADTVEEAIARASQLKPDDLPVNNTGSQRITLARKR